MIFIETFQILVPSFNLFVCLTTKGKYTDLLIKTDSSYYFKSSEFDFGTFREPASQHSGLKKLYWKTLINEITDFNFFWNNEVHPNMIGPSYFNLVPRNHTIVEPLLPHNPNKWLCTVHCLFQQICWKCPVLDTKYLSF